MPVAFAPSNQLMHANSTPPRPNSDIKVSIPSTPRSDAALLPTPQVHVNGKPAVAATSSPNRPKSSASSHAPESDGSGWGANFWVTLVDPQVSISVQSLFDAVVVGCRGRADVLHCRGVMGQMEGILYIRSHPLLLSN